MTIRLLPVLVLALTALAGCQPFLPPALRSGPLAVQIRHPGLTTRVVAKRPRDVVTYQVTLVTAGTSTAVTGIGTNPVSLTAPTRTTSFSNVQQGTYEVLIDALDGTPPSLSEGGNPVRSDNQATVAANGAVTWSAGSAFAVTVPLADATTAGRVASAQVTITADPLPLPDPTPSLPARQATAYGIALVNNATQRSEAKAVTNAFNLGIGLNTAVVTVTDVRTGDRSGTDPTHEYWFFQVWNMAPNRATPAKRQVVAAAASGDLAANTAATVPAPVLDNAVPGPTPPTLTPLAGQIAADKDDTLYVATATGIHKATAADYGTLTPVAAPAGLVAMTADRFGNVYYTTGSGILMRAAPGHGTETTAVTAANVGLLAVDGDRSLYYRNTATGMVMKAEFNGTTWETPVSTEVQIGTSSRLAVDAYGNLYFIGDGLGTGTAVMRAALNRNRSSYSAAVTFADCPDTVTELAVDRAGNAYYVNDNEAHQIWMTPAGNAGTRFLVAGSGEPGAGATVPSGNGPLGEILEHPKNLAVSPTGTFFFTSLGAGAASYLRTM